ncbi:MAG: DUF1492 domain-containing protein [Clostridia bacterium]|nr:DUF1492 domain-containing protein [Clostridia bacterium]
MEDKVWSKTLLSSYSCLEPLSNAVDGMVLSSGLHSAYGFNTTMKSACAILNLISRKKLLINIKVLVERVLDKLQVDYARLLVLKYFDKAKVNDILTIMGLSRRTYFRKINSAIESFSIGLQKEGFSSNIIKNMVKDEMWINELYSVVKAKENSRSKEDFEFSDIKLMNMAYSSFKKISTCC